MTTFVFIACICVYLHANIEHFYLRTIRTYMVDNTTTGTPKLVVSVAERYECLTSDHKCGGSNPAEDII